MRLPRPNPLFPRPGPFYYEPDDRTIGYKFLAARLDLSPDDEEVVLYGLEVVVYAPSNLVLVAAAGALLGAFWPTMMASLAAGTVKTWAGGAHASSLRNCSLITLVVFGGLGWLAARIGPALPTGGLFVLLGGTLAATLAVILRWAPADTPNKPLTNPDHRRGLRRTAVATVALWGIALGALAAGAFGLPADAARAAVLGGTLGLAWQSLTIAPTGYRFLDVLDSGFNRLWERRFAG